MAKARQTLNETRAELGQGSEGSAGAEVVGIPSPRGGRAAHLVRGRGPGSSTRYWSMIFSTSFCFSRRRALSWSLGGWAERRQARGWGGSEAQVTAGAHWCNPADGSHPDIHGLR